MTFDPRSLKHLREIGRQLPQKLPEPGISQQKEHFSNSKSHPIETEEDPETLFKELMKASPDGNVPSHLITRLKEIESNQPKQRKDRNLNQSPNTDLNKDKTLSKGKVSTRTEEEILYDTFDDFLFEEEE